jgi:uncharacterized Tic20 family protein
MSQTPHSYAGGQPTVSPGEERTMGTLAHAIALVAMVVSAGVLGFVASLVLWFLYRDKGPFVRAQVANSLNIQITTGIILLVSLPLMLILVGFVTWGIAIVVAFVLHVVGAIKANRGEWWDPPLTPHFVR